MAIIISLLAVAVLTAADQLIKYFVEADLKPIGCADFIDGFIGWRYVQNTGAAFGSFSTKTVWLSVFTGIVIAIGIYLIVSKRIKSKGYLVCAVMIISGGLGNLIDRVAKGYVVDFIEVRFMDFAVFNFADILVTVGAFMIIAFLIVGMVKDSGKKSKGDKNE